MRDKEASLYRGKGMKYEGKLHSKRWATKGMTCTPMTLMTLGQPVNLCISLWTSLTVTPQVRPGVVMDPWSEGATEKYKSGMTDPIK